MRKSMKHTIALALSSALLLSGCAGGVGENPNDGTVNENTEQTEFHIVSGISVLNELMQKAGIKINWETMSDSLGEQVNIRITGGNLPDAFQAVGFSNYDIGRHGHSGTFLDLTPYLTPDIMPNLCAILDENPRIRAAITQADGMIYGLPAAEMMGTAATGAEEDYSIHSIQQFSMINKKWLDDLGLPEIPSRCPSALTNGAGGRTSSTRPSA